MAQDDTLIENDVLGFALRPDTVQGELYFIAALTVVVSVMFAGLSFFVPDDKIKGQPKTDDRLHTMLLLLWLPFAPLLVYWGHVDTFTNMYSSTVDKRLYGVSPEGASFMRVYVALQLLGTFVEFAHGCKDVFILVHHLSSVAAYVSILCNQRSYAYACVLGLSETTTIFLNFLMLTKHRRYKEWCAKKISWLQPLSGGLLWLLWIPYRLILFLAIIWRYASDMVSGTEGALRFTTYETYFYPGVTAALWIMSVLWFRKIHRGMIKAFFGATAKDKAKDKAKTK